MDVRLHHVGGDACEVPAIDMGVCPVRDNQPFILSDCIAWATVWGIDRKDTRQQGEVRVGYWGTSSCHSVTPCVAQSTHTQGSLVARMPVECALALHHPARLAARHDIQQCRLACDDTRSTVESILAPQMLQMTNMHDDSSAASERSGGGGGVLCVDMLCCMCSIHVYGCCHCTCA